MEAAALYAVGAREGIAVGCILTVSDAFDSEGGRERIEDHDLLAGAHAMGAAADRRPDPLTAGPPDIGRLTAGA